MAANSSQPQVLPELEDFAAADDADSAFDDNSSTCVAIVPNARKLQRNAYMNQLLNIPFLQRSSRSLREWKEIPDGKDVNFNIPSDEQQFESTVSTSCRTNSTWCLLTCWFRTLLIPPSSSSKHSAGTHSFAALLSASRNTSLISAQVQEVGRAMLTTSSQIIWSTVWICFLA